MLRVTIEVIPADNEPRQIIGTMDICLSRHYDGGRAGNYLVGVWRTPVIGAWKQGKIVGYRRRNKRYHAWDLVRSALNVVLAGRKTWGADIKISKDEL